VLGFDKVSDKVSDKGFPENALGTDSN